MIISAAGNLEHGRVRELINGAFGTLGRTSESLPQRPPAVTPSVLVRTKELEQSHICLGTNSYQQNHDDRYVSYILNSVLGGSMSSRLFQNVREKRGLAYSVFSGMSAYRDAGNLTIYAGCAADAVEEVIDLSVEELRVLKRTPVPDDELKRAKDHLKGSLMLSLENTASRMSHLARQEIYFDRHFTLDETLAGVQRGDVGRHPARGCGSAVEWFAGGDRTGAEGAGLAGDAARSWLRCRLILAERDDPPLYTPGHGRDLERAAPLPVVARR